MRGPAGSNSVPYLRSMWALTWLPRPSRNRPAVFSANSHASPAAMIGLRGNATAMPVQNSSEGAALEAAAIDIHGVWVCSVKSIPENPTFSILRARSAVAAQVCEPVIRSNRMPPV